MKINNIEGRKFFDRQMQVFGEKGQADISRTWVMIYNLTGVNAELAKNLALLGFNIFLCDGDLIQLKDFSSNLWLNDCDKDYMGTSKGQFVAAQIQKMNPLIRIELCTKGIDESYAAISKCSLFSLCPKSFEDFKDVQSKLLNFEGTKFYTFCDYAFGMSFVENKYDSYVQKLKNMFSTANEKGTSKLLKSNKFFAHFESSDNFDYNQDSPSFFVFNGIYGSLIAQAMLGCVLEGSLEFNFMSYDVFGDQVTNSDPCSFITKTI